MPTETEREAEALGALIEPFCEGEWIWSHGRHARSSIHHYGVSFQSPTLAAQHFLKSREGQSARRRNLRDQ